ncbi:YciI family protein [bacterium]|nr:YciI family protein [bacterium]
MNLFIYKLQLNARYHDFSTWDEQVQKAFAEHAQYLQEGITKGILTIVGRTDTVLKDNFGIVVFQAENIDLAHEYMNADPAVKHGVMNAMVYPFKQLTVTDAAKKWNVW